MDLANLIEGLSHPGSYPFPVSDVQVRHTHISVVFLAGPYAYKIKKPVQMGFLDFATLEKRRHFCEEEVRLNRRLAPDVYLGVVPVTAGGTGLQMEGSGAAIEWAVKMQRLPQEATLANLLSRGEIETDLVRALARKIASFHAQAAVGKEIAELGRFDVVAGNARENFEQAVSQVGTTLHANVHERLRFLTEQALTQLRPLIEKRAAAGVPRDTHGDLHLDHVYLLPQHPSRDQLVIIDCIEFNKRFRFADPVADMAFLVMDFLFHGRRDLANAFAEEYFHTARDKEGLELVPFYTAYRAAVRGKVEGFKLGEKEVPKTERAAALTRARAHWFLALGELEEPGRRPCLVLLGGLPGTGKSTLARVLAERTDFHIVRSDVVRKELANTPTAPPKISGFEEGIYTPDWTERTYRECLHRAQQLLFEGKRVLVDATFREEKNRRAFLETALHWGVPGVFLVCQAEPDEIRKRLKNRRRDVSDADWDIYSQAALRWDELSPSTRQHSRDVNTDTGVDKAVVQALEILRELRLSS